MGLQSEWVAVRRVSLGGAFHQWELIFDVCKIAGIAQTLAVWSKMAECVYDILDIGGL